MSTPTIFLSAATIDLKVWRDHLHHAFSRAGFRVLTQGESLRAAPGDVKRLLSETIEEADCVIHLAGMGYGGHATDPFPADPCFLCSWTHFEYYHAHQQGKDVIAFVCSPNLSAKDFQEKDQPGIIDAATKAKLQLAHRQRVDKGEFTGTPLAGKVNRTSNETADSAGKLLESVAAAVGTLKGIESQDREKAQKELREIANTITRVEVKVDHMLRGQEQLAAQMRAMQEALSRIQQQTDPARDPISQWPQERLEAALAEQMQMPVGDLHTILIAGRTSLDALVAGQALLASGKQEAAGEKFDLVIQQEHAAAQRLRQAWEGKAQIAFDAVQYESALSYRQKVAALVDKATDPLDWADAQSEVELIHLYLAHYDKSEPRQREIVCIYREKLDPDDPKLATSLNNLAALLKSTNQLREAEPLMQRALEIDAASHGEDHPDVAIDLNNLAALLQATNRLSEAEPLSRRAVRISLLFAKATGHEHPNFRLITARYLEILTDLALSGPEQRAKLESLGAELGLSAAEVAAQFGALLPAVAE